MGAPHSSRFAIRRSACAPARAIGLLCSLIDKIVLTPNEAGDDLRIALHGELAGIFKIATDGSGCGADNDEFVSALQLVAEDRYPLNLLWQCFDIENSAKPDFAIQNQ